MSDILCNNISKLTSQADILNWIDRTEAVEVPTAILNNSTVPGVQSSSQQDQQVSCYGVVKARRVQKSALFITVDLLDERIVDDSIDTNGFVSLQQFERQAKLIAASVQLVLPVSGRELAVTGTSTCDSKVISDSVEILCDSDPTYDPAHLRKGAVIRCLAGRPVSERPGSLSLYISGPGDIQLMRCSPDPTAITRFLEAITSSSGVHSAGKTGYACSDSRTGWQPPWSKRHRVWSKALYCSSPEDLYRLVRLMTHAGTLPRGGATETATVTGASAVDDDGSIIDDVVDVDSTSAGTGGNSSISSVGNSTLSMPSLSRAVGMHSRIMAGRAPRRDRKREMHIKPVDLAVLCAAERDNSDLLRQYALSEITTNHMNGDVDKDMDENGDNSDTSSNISPGATGPTDATAVVATVDTDAATVVATVGAASIATSATSAPVGSALDNGNGDGNGVHSSNIVPDSNLPAGAEGAASARGPLSRGQYYHGKKMPQVKWIVHRLADMQLQQQRQRQIQSQRQLFDDGNDQVSLEHNINASGRARLFRHYLDIGGGRGDLAFSIAQTFPDCIVTMIDRNLKSLAQAEARSRVLGIYERMRFVCASLQPNDSVARTDTSDHVPVCGGMDSDGYSSCGVPAHASPSVPACVPVCRNNDDIMRILREQQQHQQQQQQQDAGNTCGSNSNCSNAAADSTPAAELPPVDCVVALHACGGLSDLALQFAAINDAAFLVVPCCYVKCPVEPALWGVCKQESGKRNNSNNSNSNSHSDDRRSSSEDARRHGHKYLSSEQRAVLLSLAESSIRDISLRASRVVNSERLQAVCDCAYTSTGADAAVDMTCDWERHHKQQQAEQLELQRRVTMEYFPESYSLRNTVLVRY